MSDDIIEKYGKDPLSLFKQWLNEAEKTEINDANAMFLSSVDPDGHPSVRTVLLKGFDERGFVFYTNFESRKGKALLANPYAETLFYWKSLEKQIRISGPVEQVSNDEANAYYNARHRVSRIGAWASKQSREMEHANALKEREAEFTKKFENVENPPRPENWSGFRIIPKRVEFWIAGEFRLHTRFVYTKTEDDNAADDWNVNWLYP
ncbi:MAG: pyridoxamine 5'-phosphate oxidase [Alphaproteobacteria bacterium]|nr:pyridoxamine 5'-phosphate oxidase [Alphaproteobacteria bacterium]